MEPNQRYAVKIIPTFIKTTGLKLFVLGFICLFPLDIYAQLGGGGIFGVSSVKVGDEFNYSAMSSCSYYTWTVSKGTIIGSSSGSSIRVKWTQSGTGQIQLNCGGTLYSLNVSIGLLLPTPSFTVSNNCGSSQLVRGNPPSGVTFYWQTNSTGTSTSNSAKSWTVTSSGTYYLRARDNASGQWGSAYSQYASPYSLPEQPPMPSLGYNCGNTTITRPGNTSNLSYYWQTSSSGTATSNSSNPYIVQSPGTYYLRARNSNGCWSTARSFNVSVNEVPPAPPSPIEQSYCGYSVLSRSNPPTGITYYWQTSSTATSTANSAATFTVNSPGLNTVFLRGRSSQGCWGASQSYTVDVKALPVAPTNAINDYRFGEGTISPSVESDETHFRWYTQASGGTPITGVSGKMYTHNPGTTSTYYVASVNEDGCESSRIAVIAYRYPPAIIGSGDDMVLETGATITLTTNDFDSYQWIRDGRPVGTAPELVVNWPGEYWVEVTKGNASAVSPRVYIDRAPDVFPYRERQHMVITRVKIEGIESADISNVDENDLQHTIHYTDGLGRPLQTIAHKASPQGKDIVQAYVYNEYGLSPRQFLPYASQVDNGRFQADALVAGTYEQSAQYLFYQNTEAIASDTKPYSESRYEASPLHRLKETVSAGEAWHVGQKTNTTRQRLNAASDAVRKWKINMDTGLPESIEEYPIGSLHATITIDADNRIVEAYTDLRGRQVLVRQLTGDEIKRAETYTIYDAFDRPVFVLPPEAVARVHTANIYTPNSDFIHSWAFWYEYDERHRVIGQKAPGTAWQHMVFDRWDRPVLMQDGNRRDAGEWVFMKYDMLNRRVMVGTYDSGQDREALQAAVDNFYLNAPELRGEERGSAMHGYTNRSFPTGVTEDNLLQISYFDGYDFIPPGATHLAYVASLANSTQPSGHVRSLATGSKTRILGVGEDEWLMQVLYYDDDYRLVQGIAENHLGGTERHSLRYDFSGQVQEYLHVHKGSETSVRTRESYTYDAIGRLLEVEHQIDEGAPILLNSFRYNALGEIIEKKLHSEDHGSSFVQHLGYRYNIRGMPLSVSSTQPGSGAEGFFSMALAYEQPLHDGIAHVPSYSGNITAMSLSNKGLGDEIQQAYSYNYDDLGRLSNAQHYEKGAVWSSTEALTVDNITYDANGNIQALSRKDSEGQPLDLLHFDYGAQGNQLQKVDDYSGQDAGFKDGGNSGPDYQYDANGNMVEDRNKSIGHIGYNVLNLPAEVLFEDSTKLLYLYDANGTKLAQKQFDAMGNVVGEITYAGRLVYEQGILKYLFHREGRYLPQSREYQYHLRDHQGNVRLTFTASPGTDTELATLEAIHEDDERAVFLNYDGTTKINSALFDHTGNGGTHYATRLNGSENERIGLARSLAVMTGDTIRAEVYAKYLDPNPSNWTTALQGLMAAIAGGTAPPGTVIEAVPPSGGDNFPFAGLLDAAKTGDTGPKAYLNILLFDDNLAFLDGAFVPVTAAAKENGSDVSHEKLSKEIVVQQPGYAYIYLSNDSGTPLEVFFDDFMVAHAHSPIVQADGYYPFGMRSSHHSREGSLPNRYLYNGGSELNARTGLYETSFRQYDAAVGRFTGVDPLAGHYSGVSPYHYGFNSPVNFNDPTGLMPAPMPRSSASEGCGACGLQGGGRIGPGSGSHWSDGMDNKYRDYFLMGSGAFEEKWGQGASGYEKYGEGGWGYSFDDAHGILRHEVFPDGEYILLPGATVSAIERGNPYRGWGNADYWLNHVGESGFYEGMIPVWGAGRDAIDNFQSGDYSQAVAYAALAVTDVFLVRSAIKAIGKLGARAAAKGGYSTIYRAVSKAELDDIARFGLRNKAGAYETGKLFAPTMREAAQFGKNNFMFDGLPNTIMKVRVPNSVLNNAYRFGADGMNAISIPANQLYRLRATPLNYNPLLR